MNAFLQAPTVRPHNAGSSYLKKCGLRRLGSAITLTQRRVRGQALRAAVEPLILSEATVQQALDEVVVKLGSVFGNSEENRSVGITGQVALASLDGPIVVLRLQGRFWHKRADVFARVSAYLLERIPEICDTQIEDESQLLDDENTAAAL